MTIKQALTSSPYKDPLPVNRHSWLLFTDLFWPLAANQYTIKNVAANMRVQIRVGLIKQTIEQKQLNFGSQPNIKIYNLPPTIAKDIIKKLDIYGSTNCRNIGTGFP